MINRDICGVLAVNKHAGVTSHDIVYKTRRLYGTSRVGHTGTLDPMATGVLVMLVGRAAKAAEYLVSDSKRYRAKIQLGITTDTEDTTGNILSQSEDIPDALTVERVCRGFLGKISQIPPMYSALKVGGRKLCDLARQGIEVERQPREVEIFSLDVSATDRADIYSLDVRCSSGTYIRTLCADIGKSLGCGAAMAELERTETGGFNLSQALSIAELEEMSEEERDARLVPVEKLFLSLPSVKLPPFYEKLSRCGCEIYQKKIGTNLPISQRVRLLGENGFFALAEVRDFPDGSALKAIKLFDIS